MLPLERLSVKSVYFKKMLWWQRGEFSKTALLLRYAQVTRFPLKHSCGTDLLDADSLLQLVHPRKRLKRRLDVVVRKPVRASAAQQRFKLTPNIGDGYPVSGLVAASPAKDKYMTFGTTPVRNHSVQADRQEEKPRQRRLTIRGTPASVSAPCRERLT